MNSSRASESDVRSIRSIESWPDYPWHKGERCDLELDDVTNDNKAQEQVVQIECCSDYIERKQDKKYWI